MDNYIMDNYITDNYKQIIETDQIKIFQNNKNKTIFSLYLNETNEPLINSIIKPKFISASFTTDNHSKMFFNALNVKTFNQYKKEQYKQNQTSRLPIETVSRIINNLSTQLNFLIKRYNMAFLGYNQQNIIVINDTEFIYLDTEYLLPFNQETEKLNLTFPFSQNDFYMSPELFDIKEIPSKTHYRSSYYSLGCLFLYLLKDENENTDTNTNTNTNTNINTNINTNLTKHTYHDQVIDTLNSLHIKDTKIFFLLKRSLDIDERKRSLLFI